MRTLQLVLNITKCPEDHTGTKAIEMENNSGSIGRNSSCTVTLIDIDRFISGSHCLIHFYSDTYYISDVSTNGTLVNGNRILKNQPIPIHDGDVITLGRYEMMLSFEANIALQNIAVDIAAERESCDPLLCFENDGLLAEKPVAGIEALFMETREHEIDNDDPIAHLDLAVKEQEDFLLQEQSLPSNSDEIAHSLRQIQDDSASIFAHYSAPDFIPENWLKAPLSADADSHQSSLAITPMLSPPLQANHLDANLPLPPEKREYWEDLPPTHSFSTPEISVSHIQRCAEQDQPLLVPRSRPSDVEMSFFQGLGISNQDSICTDPTFFKLMGSCLKLCIDKLQQDLLAVEKLKSPRGQQRKNDNIIELMLALHEQNLLSPTELIEQILDELAQHNMQGKQAIKEAIRREVVAYDPQQFAKECALTSRFISEKQLWRQYVIFFNHKSRNLKH